MGSIPLPALSVNTQQASPLDTYSKILGLREMQARQALIPGEMQQQQQQLQAGATANQSSDIKLQQDQIALNDQKLLTGIYQKHASGGSSSGSSASSDQPTADGTPPTPRTMPSVDMQSNIGSMIQDAMDQGVSPGGIKSLLDFQKTQLDVANQTATLDKATREGIQAKNTATWNAAETLRAIPEGSPERAQAYQGTLQNLQQQGVDTSKFPKQVPSNAQLDQIEAPLAMINGAIELGTKKSQAASAAQSADPVLKLSTPEALAAPGAKASIQTLIDDPKTKPEDVPRLQALLPKADVAQASVIHQKQSEALAEQAAQEGDPKAAAQLLISGDVAPSQLISSRRPAFAQQAFSAAAQMQPGWNAQKADADFQLAKGQQSQAFFGSANSLLNKGGTLDQLANTAQSLPKNKFPKLNTVADYLSYNYGDPATAAFAATAIGVADDYAKVMGGGTGSDTARIQVLNSLSAAQNPEQRAAVLQNVRNAVTSQRDSRIGANPVMQKMYGAGAVPASGGAQGGGQASQGTAASQSVGHKVGDMIMQGGKSYRATKVDANGKVLAAE